MQNIIMTKWYAAILALCIIAIIAVFAMAPALVHAQTSSGPIDGPIVHCGRDGTPDCELCDLLVLFQRLLNFGFWTLVPGVTALGMGIAGLMIIFGSTTGTVQRGSEMFTGMLKGIAIIFAAWMITNFAIKIIAADHDVSNSWYIVQCENPSGVASTPSGVLQPDICLDNAALAAEYNTAPQPTNHPNTDGLLSCLKSNLESDPEWAGQVNVRLGSIFTYDESHPKCNLTRGDPVCGSCSHSINSCHYGGTIDNPEGDRGALAIDIGGEAFYEDIFNVLRNACSLYVEAAHCEANGKFVNNYRDSSTDFQCTNPNVTHIHVTVRGCNRL